MFVEVEPLPYPVEALAPYMSAPSLRFHHTLYARYVAGVNSRARVSSIAEALELADQQGDVKLREQAAQAQNHLRFFRSMAPPRSGNQAGPQLARALHRYLGNKRRGSYAWRHAAESVFGSGWVWLLADDEGALRIDTTRNAGIPQGHPLLVMDVWEHAYYLDYPTERGRYADTWLRHLADWNRASVLYDAVLR